MSQSVQVPVSYGLIGCGGFGKWCLDEYRIMPELKLAGVADADAGLAKSAALKFGLEVYSPSELIERDDIELIHIASPPSTHAALGLAALRAGKHVLSEKPLALTVEDAVEMATVAAERKRTLGVNQIMRYNRLCRAVKEVIDGRLLGEPLYATLLNAAQDELLPPQHWFWDSNQSGGIFVEHGVHFFDVFEWWFGEGEILSAHQLTRPGTALAEQVVCTVRYGQSTVATFYHGFHQMLRRDRQAWQIVCEYGVISMTEWVPTEMHIDATLPDKHLEMLMRILPEATATIIERYPQDRRSAISRHQHRTVELHASIQTTAGPAKMQVYGQMLRALMSDQIAAIRNAGHTRLVSDENGILALRYAIAAAKLARSDLEEPGTRPQQPAAAAE